MAFYGTDLLWGCPQMNFKANPPFNEMRQVPIFIGIATFKKGTHMAPQEMRLYPNFLISYYILKGFTLSLAIYYQP